MKIIKKLRSCFIRFAVFFLGRIFSLALRDQEVQNLIWKSANIRPLSYEMFYAALPNSVDEERYRLATRQSAEYVQKHMNHLEAIHHRFDLLSFCLRQATGDGLFLEFGVCDGSV